MAAPDSRPDRPHPARGCLMVSSRTPSFPDRPARGADAPTILREAAIHAPPPSPHPIPEPRPTRAARSPRRRRAPCRTNPLASWARVDGPASRPLLARIEPNGMLGKWRRERPAPARTPIEANGTLGKSPSRNAPPGSGADRSQWLSGATCRAGRPGRASVPPRAANERGAVPQARHRPVSGSLRRPADHGRRPGGWSFIRSSGLGPRRSGAATRVVVRRGRRWYP